MVRNMGKVDDSSTFSDNDWEKVRSKSAKNGRYPRFGWVDIDRFLQTGHELRI